MTPNPAAILANRLLLVPLVVVVTLGVLQLANCAPGAGEPKSCECWKLDECPSNCTGTDVQNLLSKHNEFFAKIKRPFVIFYPWFGRSYRPSPGVERSKKCGTYAGIRRFWITLLGKKHVRIHLTRKGSIIDSKLNIISTAPDVMIRADMNAGDFSSYQTGVIEDGKNVPFKDSYAAVIACRGLRGVIQVDGRSYLIQPLPRPSKGRHLGRPHVIYPAPEPKIERNLRSKTFWMHTLPDLPDIPLVNVSASKWILNLAVILDHKLIQKFNRDRDRVNFFGFFAARLINLATQAFQNTGLELRLSTLLMMEQPGRVETNSDIKDTLNKLMLYLLSSAREVTALGNPTNATLLLTTQPFKENVEYLAVPVSMCTGSNRAVGVVQVLDIGDEYHVSKLIALALADMFGIRGFPCPRSKLCDSGPVLSAGDRMRLRLTITGGIAHCLAQIPPRAEPIRDPPNLCGNGIIDRGEECDSATSPCCLAKVCLARGGVQCLDGTPRSGCCRNCSLLAPGTVCRGAKSECDLPEMCNGRSGACGGDVTLEDGQPCAGGLGFCVRGRCPTLDSQCREVWGPGARAANDECFRQINTQKGHCGSRRKCNKVRNTKCGVLHCEGGQERPRLGEAFWKTTTPSDNSTTECKYLKDKAPRQRRFVADGTKCEEHRLCQAAECRPVGSVFRSACPSARPGRARLNRTCSLRGVCLSTHRCLCRPGWGGPSCSHRVPYSEASTPALLRRLIWKHLDGSGFGKFANGSSRTRWRDDRSDESGGLVGALDTVTLVIILASVIGGGAFLLVVIFMLCYRRRSSHRQRSAALAGNGDVLWPNKGPGYALPKDQLHMDYTDGIERRKRKRKRRGRQRRNSRGKIIGSRYGEGDYVEDTESIERIIKFGSMPSYREDKLNKGVDNAQCPPGPYPSHSTALPPGVVSSCGAISTGFGSGSGSDSGSHGRSVPVPSSLNRNPLSASSSAGSPADVYAAMLGGGTSVGALPSSSCPIDSVAEGRHPEKGILKNKNIGDLQELANLLSDKVRHSMGPPTGPPAGPEALQASGVVDLPPCSAPGPVVAGVAPGSFQVRIPPRLPPPPPPAATAAAALRHSHNPAVPACSHEKTNAISGSSCTSDDDSSSCSSLSSTGTAVQPPVILCNAGQQTEPVPTDESEPEDGSCVTGGEGLSEPEVDQDFLKEEVKSTEGTCWDSAEEELTDGEELLPRAVLRSAELLEDFAQKIPSTNLLLRSLQQQQQHKAPLYRDKAPLQPPPPSQASLQSSALLGGAQVRPNASAGRQGEGEREATRRKRQSYTKATESYESLPPASGPGAAC